MGWLVGAPPAPGRSILQRQHSMHETKPASVHVQKERGLLTSPELPPLASSFLRLFLAFLRRPAERSFRPVPP